MTGPQRPITQERGLRVMYCARECERYDADPAEHLPTCPVAPVAGLHGGMRAAPEPAGPVASWRQWGRYWEAWGDFGSGWSRMFPVDPARLGLATEGERDLSLAAFYLPPAAVQEPDRRPPADGDPDLEAVLDAASNHPSEWRAR